MNHKTGLGKADYMRGYGSNGTVMVLYKNEGVTNGYISFLPIGYSVLLTWIQTSLF